MPVSVVVFSVGKDVMPLHHTTDSLHRSQIALLTINYWAFYFMKKKFNFTKITNLGYNLKFINESSFEDNF